MTTLTKLKMLLFYSRESSPSGERLGFSFSVYKNCSTHDETTLKCVRMILIVVTGACARAQWFLASMATSFSRSRQWERGMTLTTRDRVANFFSHNVTENAADCRSTTSIHLSRTQHRTSEKQCRWDQVSEVSKSQRFLSLHVQKSNEWCSWSNYEDKLVGKC